MLIEKAFEKFHHKTIIDAKFDKEIIELCNKIHSDANLIDISSINKIQENKANNICLPFDNCFIKSSSRIYEELKTDIYIYIREYAPGIYTGAIIGFLCSNYFEKIVSQTFDIKIKQNSYILNVHDIPNFENTNLSYRAEKLINSTLYTLENISYSNTERYLSKPIKFKLKDKITKFNKNIKKPIYIYTNKKNRKTIFEKYGENNLKRETSWQVRGHWRHLSSQYKRGKNQNGEYIVEGFTWVKPHLCGDINKINKRTYIAIKGD